MSFGSSAGSVHILLAGTGGIPGRNILNSLQRLIFETRGSNPNVEIKLTILKRSSAQKSDDPRSVGTVAGGDDDENINYDIAYVGDFNNVPILSQSLQALDPDIVISALNAEPAPQLDNHLIDAILLLNRARTQASTPSGHTGYSTPEQRRSSSAHFLPSLQSLSLSSSSQQQTSSPTSQQQQQQAQPQSSSAQYGNNNNKSPSLTENSSSPSSRKKILFISGYTLDILHPTVRSIPSESQTYLQPKIAFAHRLHSLAEANELEYTTIINAAFLDYCLSKGYMGINLPEQKATMYGSGDQILTGCSLEFVGDVVALIAKFKIDTLLLATAVLATGGDTVSEREREKAIDRYERVKNHRLRVAETAYSGSQLLEIVQNVTGSKFDVVGNLSLDKMREDRGPSIIRYLNWAGEGASSFVDDGLGFASRNDGASGNGSGGSSESFVNDLTLKRRTLEEIVRWTVEHGADVYGT